MKTCALVAACDFNAEHFRARYEAGSFDCVIAVDRGYAWLSDLEITPDVVLGDFDSLGYVPAGNDVLTHSPIKDASDTELAFEEALARGFDSVELYGALGGRIDHTIANLQVCARYAERGMSVVLVGMQEALRILVGPARFELPLLEKGTVSVFAATDTAEDVCEEGLFYPLEHALLNNRTSLGLSNELLGKPAAVSVGKGTVYIVYPLA